jgi:hypothetical protein
VTAPNEGRLGMVVQSHLKVTTADRGGEEGKGLLTNFRQDDLSDRRLTSGDFYQLPQPSQQLSRM